MITLRLALSIGDPLLFFMPVPKESRLCQSMLALGEASFVIEDAAGLWIFTPRSPERSWFRLAHKDGPSPLEPREVAFVVKAGRSLIVLDSNGFAPKPRGSEAKCPLDDEGCDAAWARFPQPTLLGADGEVSLVVPLVSTDENILDDYSFRLEHLEDQIVIDCRSSSEDW
jgi:hypothetical protein